MKSETAAAMSSDDDAEANGDLSLKIVRKAILRTCESALNDDALYKPKSVDGKKSKKGTERKEKKIGINEFSALGELDLNFKNFCSNIIGEDDMKEEESEKTSKTMKSVSKAVETNPLEPSDNSVLQRLLRGPRYFDPQDSNWGACYNCGEEGHTTVNCTSAKHKKPCFVCGSVEHNAKQCAKLQDCFICKRGGHCAKNCPERNSGGSQSYKICLKCGDSGHDMFSCRNDYCPDDLKGIQCYICKRFGHLCCANYPDNGPRELSCYRCGLLGHTGLACTKSHNENSGMGLVNSCYCCGEGGHYAHECTKSLKHNKRSRELSTAKKKVSKGKKEHLGFRSARHGNGYTRKNKSQYESGFTSAYKAKRKGGWIMDDPRDFPEPHTWISPSTPSTKRTKTYDRKTDRRASVSGSKYYHRRFLASRFGNNSHDRMKRNYDW